MLTLLLLRHAKAVPHSGDDFARALTDKGLADAARLGGFLVKQRLVPDHALVSPAARTRQTMETVDAAIGRPVTTSYEPALYNATASHLRDRIQAVDASVTTLAIVGHNPGIVDLALALAGSGDLQDFEAMRSHFPPCSLVVLEFDRVDWMDVGDGNGRLDWFMTPDLLKDRS